MASTCFDASHLIILLWITRYNNKVDGIKVTKWNKVISDIYIFSFSSHFSAITLQSSDLLP